MHTYTPSFQYTLMLPRQKRGRCSSKDGLAPSVSRPLSNCVGVVLVWDELDRSVRKAHPTNQQSLIEELKKAWNSNSWHIP
ncbi:hypothetical protein L3Q82_010866 [Scortum barcoo]|uniref:Uncharacterized protein n=1 Tax=Scortum barcoo TaxID=214431 RepID=A0ACB8W856_9TELE|nr:hypothetical protein L3Q82_010866 [Scortum barcoo]